MKNTQFGVMNEYSFDVNNKLQCIIYIVHCQSTQSTGGWSLIKLFCGR